MVHDFDVVTIGPVGFPCDAGESVDEMNSSSAEPLPSFRKANQAMLVSPVQLDGGYLDVTLRSRVFGKLR
jgi:hypothetical protein